ncbi:MAG: metallophosphoesterase [Clostridia bacterium]|nr:metallophosphoesterase [Clostridia bacterium]
MIYFTGDLHFEQRALLKWRRRFATVEEMDKTLIDGWNATVGENDTVYVLGDLFHDEKVSARKYLNRLSGRIVLIKGNHDALWLDTLSDREKKGYFSGIYDLHGIEKDGAKLRFCHYPMISWDGSRSGSVLICGHLHGRDDNNEYRLFRRVPLMFNAGVDVNGFKPVCFSELVANNDVFYKRRRTKEEIEVLERMVRVYG